MTTLRDIRRRLQSVENVKKITDAMERVAAARLKKAQSKAESSRPFAKKLTEILHNLSSSNISFPFFEKRKVTKTGIAIFAADRGLSGSYNAALLSKADEFLQKYDHSNAELFLVGRKAIDHYKRSGWTIRYQKADWGGKITLPEVQELTDLLVKSFLSHELDEIWLVYTHYITIFSRKVVLEKFLSIEKTKSDNRNGNYIYEPNEEEILNAILPRYCLIKIQGAFQEAYASELSARIIAMRMASKNSSDMIQRLTLVRNKVRQASITKEMIEISSGAEG
jgi:F-type H+-transporting ATPase subunit gamma